MENHFRSILLHEIRDALSSEFGDQFYGILFVEIKEPGLSRVVIQMDRTVGSDTQEGAIRMVNAILSAKNLDMICVFDYGEYL